MKSLAIGLLAVGTWVALAGAADAGSVNFSATVTSGSLDGTDLTGQAISGSVNYDLLHQTAIFGPAFWGYGDVTMTLAVAGKTFTLSDPASASEYFLVWPNPFDVPGEVSLSFTDLAQKDAASLDIFSPLGPPPFAPGDWWRAPDQFSSGSGTADLGPNGQDGHIAFRLDPATPEPSSLVLAIAGAVTVTGCAWYRRRKRRS